MNSIQFNSIQFNSIQFIQFNSIQTQIKLQRHVVVLLPGVLHLLCLEQLQLLAQDLPRVPGLDDRVQVPSVGHALGGGELVDVLLRLFV